MLALLAYGSLMHPDELARHLVPRGARVPVRVRGFRRTFCQEPSWRGGDGNNRGVLTVHPSEADWFNAILVPGCPPEALPGLDARERGYRRTVVPARAVAPYASGAGDLPPVIGLYTGRPELHNPELRPNAAYATLCVEAAACWGAAFLRDFLASTYLGGGTSLLQAREGGDSGRGGSG